METGDSLNVMTYNVHHAWRSPHDSFGGAHAPRQWAGRLGSLVSVIHSPGTIGRQHFQPDVVGLQEVGTHQAGRCSPDKVGDCNLTADIMRGLARRWPGQWAVVSPSCRPGDPGRPADTDVLAYRTSRLALVRWGFVDLPYPHRPSRTGVLPTWDPCQDPTPPSDDTCPPNHQRTAVWAVFQNVGNAGRRWFVVSTHLANGHYDPARRCTHIAAARLAGVETIGCAIAAQDAGRVPVVLLGDFNDPVHNETSRGADGDTLRYLVHPSSYDPNPYCPGRRPPALVPTTPFSVRTGTTVERWLHPIRTSPRRPGPACSLSADGRMDYVFVQRSSTSAGLQRTYQVQRHTLGVRHQTEYARCSPSLHYPVGARVTWRLR